MTVEQPNLNVGGQTREISRRQHPYFQLGPSKATLARARYLWRKGVRKVTALNHRRTRLYWASGGLSAKQISLLLLGDISALAISFQGSGWIHEVAHNTQLSQQLRLVSSPVLWFVYILGLCLSNTYRVSSQKPHFTAAAQALSSNIVITLLIAFAVAHSNLWAQVSWIHYSIWIGAIALFSLWTSLSRSLCTQWRQRLPHSDSWLLVGFGHEQQPFLTDFRQLNLSKHTVVLLTENQSPPNLCSSDTTGQLTQLKDWLTARTWTGIVISHHLQLSKTQISWINEAKKKGIPILHPSDLYENYCAKIPAKTLSDNRITFSDGFRRLSGQLGARIKRLGDIALASTVLLLVFPVMLLTAILIKLDTPGPIFYSQTRTGRNMTSFKVHKFRSMVQDAEKHGAQWAQTSDSRITRVGQFIRLVRIDELPQLWNVLQGDMSMIGPRPERPEFDRQLTAEIPHYAVRYMIKPGITGWAQVLYPYGASIEDAYEKLAYDLYYIKNYSPWLDVLIVLKTLRVVLLGKGR